jgi:RNA-directed DNA polymerase
MEAPFLWSQVISWDNLWHAFRKAARGKRGRPAAATFEYGVADRLLALQAELREGSYRPGPYSSFFIHEPKRRLISAAPFRDRVVHHALCNVIEPLWERRFYPHSYANRRGKGTHRAIDQLQAWARRYRYVLRMDIVKHFPSLDHAVLLAQLAPVLREERLIWLAREILASGQGLLVDEYPMTYFPGDDLFAPLRPRGLPIGNLTSQFWSNCYLNGFDWWVSRALRCHTYLRYVDNFALFSDSKAQLYEWKQAIIERLVPLRLTIHERAAQVTPVQRGIPWLGFVVYPTFRRLKARNAVNFRRRFERAIDRYQQGTLTFAELNASVQGWINHVRYGDTWGLRRFLFDAHPIRSARLPAAHPGAP